MKTEVMEKVVLKLKEMGVDEFSVRKNRSLYYLQDDSNPAPQITHYVSSQKGDIKISIYDNGKMTVQVTTEKEI